jgi:hypothetical protein
MTKALALALCAMSLVACREAPWEEVLGPFTGETYRFVVTRLELPANAQAWAYDLNDDGKKDNRLGGICATFGSHDALADAEAIVAAGVIRPVVEIITDDPLLRDDPSVGVRFRGHLDEDGDLMGARLVAGRLLSNPTASSTRSSGGVLVLPLLKYANPVPLPVVGLHIELTPDGDGYTGELHGGCHGEPCRSLPIDALAEMLAFAAPEFPAVMSSLGNQLGDLHASNILQSLLRPDVQLFSSDGEFAPARTIEALDSLSFGVALSLAPCPDGACLGASPPACGNRRLDGREADVDCGGSCLPCLGGAACRDGDDCQTGQCLLGRCAAPTCTDGLRDGYESDVDCGGPCPPCLGGQACWGNQDCQSGNCSALLALLRVIRATAAVVVGG